MENYIQTAYGVAAVRVDEPPPADEDDAMFGSPPATEPVTYQQSGGGGAAFGSSGPGRGGKKAARLFSTSAMSREPAGCCMDDGFQRCERFPYGDAVCCGSA